MQRSIKRFFTIAGNGTLQIADRSENVPDSNGQDEFRPIGNYDIFPVAMGYEYYEVLVQVVSGSLAVNPASSWANIPITCEHVLTVDDTTVPAGTQSSHIVMDLTIRSKTNHADSLTGRIMSQLNMDVIRSTTPPDPDPVDPGLIEVFLASSSIFSSTNYRAAYAALFLRYIGSTVYVFSLNRLSNGNNNPRTLASWEWHDPATGPLDMTDKEINVSIQKYKQPDTTGTDTTYNLIFSTGGRYGMRDNSVTGVFENILGMEMQGGRITNGDNYNVYFEQEVDFLVEITRVGQPDVPIWSKLIRFTNEIEQLL